MTEFEKVCELVSQRADLDLDALINQTAYLAFGPSGKGVHGVIYSIEQGDSGKRLTRYRIGLRPQLAYLAHRHNQRIFQHLTVPQIVGHSLSPSKKNLISPSPHQLELLTPQPMTVPT